MSTGKKNWRKKLRNLATGIFVGLFIYVSIYLVNSFLGGYWTVPERDGRDKYSFGLSITDAILWQPRFGHESLGHWDYAGAVFVPLIRLDRRFIHPTLYFLDNNFDQQFAQLKASQIHPHWRDEFSTKIKVSGILDEEHKMIHCTLRYTGSDHPREITEIRLQKKFAEAVRASPPTGFTAKPYEGRQENRNEYSIRWAGQITLPYNQEVLLDIPAKYPKADKGYISFSYQRTDNTSQEYKNFTSVEFK